MQMRFTSFAIGLGPGGPGFHFFEQFIDGNSIAPTPSDIKCVGSTNFNRAIKNEPIFHNFNIIWLGPRIREVGFKYLLN